MIIFWKYNLAQNLNIYVPVFNVYRKSKKYDIVTFTMTINKMIQKFSQR